MGYSHYVIWCLVVLVGNCSLLIISYIRLGFGRFQHYLLSLKFKFISIRPTQIGYIYKSYNQDLPNRMCAASMFKTSHQTRSS